MFLPVKADFKLPHFPWMTAVICVICCGIFLKQVGDWNEFEQAVYGFCAKPRSDIAQMIFRQAAPKAGEPCIQVMYGISTAADQQAAIDGIVRRMQPLKGFSNEDSDYYVSDLLQAELRQYEIRVPEHPDAGLAYETDSWNPLTMVMSSFAHGSWSHIIFNLIFFVAFAATVEVLIGPIAFAGLFLIVSLFCGVFSSVSAIASGTHFSTLGLSGVVMGVMGLFAYLLPKGKIRCYYWFIIFFGSVAIPAWAIAIWYIGGDIYKLFASDDHGVVNVMAHVTGGIAGYLFGLVFMRRVRWQTRIMQQDADRQATRARAA